MAGLCPYSESSWNPGNEKADQKAKQGAESSQPEVPLTLKRAKRAIFPHTLTNVYCHDPRHLEPWKDTGNLGLCGSYPEASGENLRRFFFA
ncbi:hypothetical protein TNCV_1621711 [Trichonephila clavipes]|nr:hypothetical protein TNCV_1621711 [Trichonephila clavipes]